MFNSSSASPHEPHASRSPCPFPVNPKEESSFSVITKAITQIPETGTLPFARTLQPIAACRTNHLRNLLQNSICTRTITHPDMPPLLKTYFNPHHRSFLSTLFTATFLGSVLVVAFPCPVRPKDGLSSLANESATPVAHTSVQGREEGVGKPVRNGRVRDEIVVMMNERSGKRRFLAED